MDKDIITKEEKYNEFIEECRAIITEAVFTSRWALVEGYWNLGNHILKDGRGYGEEIVKRVALSLNKSQRTIQYAVQFAEKFPNLDELPDGKNISWRKVIDLLPAEKEERIALPDGKYNCIYADPPWQYWEGGEKNQSKHYKTLKIEEIKKYEDKEGRKIIDLVADNCILFLWETAPILPEAIEVMRSWGFEYSTVGFVWVKSLKDGTGFAFGNGSWTRANAEYCLIGIKGSVERKDAGILQIIYAPKEEYLKKPAIVRDKIVELVGDIPRIELFAREKTHGWDLWGTL